MLGHDTFAPLASYLTVNISSPNTPGLRDLQAPEALDALLVRVFEARERHVAADGRRVPIVVKLAPDIADDDLAPVVERLVVRGVDGIAVSNTTLTRPAVGHVPTSAESGGLSGRPLFQRSTVLLARVHRLTEGRIPLIGIGGIDSGPAAQAKIEAGATLIQLYTGLIYEGAGLVGRIKEHLAGWVRQAGASSIVDLVGRRADEWAARDPG